MTLKMGVSLELGVQLGNHKPHRSDLILYARLMTLLSDRFVVE